MKKLIFLLSIVSSFSVFAQQPFNCAFTEPFLDIDVDFTAQKAVLNEIDWESDVYKRKSTDISKSINFVSSLENGVATINLFSKKTGKSILTASLDYDGSDGMSDNVFAYSARYNPNGDRILHGGCDTTTVSAVNVPALDKNQELFFNDAKQAIVLCYARAFSSWTSEASKYEKKVSVFTILYRSDVVPGEPGNVSQTFSSYEGEDLTRLAKLASDVPYAGGELKSHKELKINFCDKYAEYLQKRYETKDNMN